MPISFAFYLIQTEKRNILVDVGCNDGAGFPMMQFCKPTEIIQMLGLNPQDITDVLITHAHHDHIEAISTYENAVVYIQEDEYQNGKRYIPPNMTVKTFTEEYALCDGITMKRIGGHDVGSCIVVCQAGGKHYVLCGDECYVKKCISEKIPTGMSYNQDKSKAFIEEYSKEKYIPLLFHDPDILTGKLGFEAITP